MDNHLRQGCRIAIAKTQSLGEGKHQLRTELRVFLIGVTLSDVMEERGN